MRSELGSSGYGNHDTTRLLVFSSGLLDGVKEDQWPSLLLAGVLGPIVKDREYLAAKECGVWIAMYDY